MPNNYNEMLALKKRINEECVLPFITGAVADEGPNNSAVTIIKYAISYIDVFAKDEELLRSKHAELPPYCLALLEYYKAADNDCLLKRTLIKELLHEYLKPIPCMQVKQYTPPAGVTLNSISSSLLGMPTDIQKRIASFLDERSLSSFTKVCKTTARFFHPANSEQFTLCYEVGSNLRITSNDASQYCKVDLIKEIAGIKERSFIVPTLYQAIQCAFANSHKLPLTEQVFMPPIWLVLVSRPLEKIDFHSFTVSHSYVMGLSAVNVEVFCTQDIPFHEITRRKGVLVSHPYNKDGHFGQYQILGRVNMAEEEKNQMRLK